MDTQHITPTATENVAPTTSTKMSKEELQQKSDKELLSLVEKSKGHTGNDFSDYMNCDFFLFVSYHHIKGQRLRKWVAQNFGRNFPCYERAS